MVIKNYFYEIRKAAHLGGFSFLILLVVVACKSHDVKVAAAKPFSIPEWAVSLKSQVTSSEKVDEYQQVYIFPPLEIDVRGVPLQQPKLREDNNKQGWYVDDDRSKVFREQLATGFDRRFKVLNYEEYCTTEEPTLVCSLYFTQNISQAEHYTCFFRMELSLFKGEHAEEKIIIHNHELMAMFNLKKEVKSAYEDLLEHLINSMDGVGEMEKIVPWSEVTSSLF